MGLAFRNKTAACSLFCLVYQRVPPSFLTPDPRTQGEP